MNAKDGTPHAVDGFVFTFTRRDHNDDEDISRLYSRGFDVALDWVLRRPNGAEPEHQ
jgi:hypothetical protein